METKGVFIKCYQRNMKLHKQHWNKWKISGKMRQISLKCSQALHMLFFKIITEVVCVVDGIQAVLYCFSSCTAGGSEGDLFIYLFIIIIIFY